VGWVRERNAREWCIVDRSGRDKRYSRSRDMVVVAPRLSGLPGSRGLDGWGLSKGWIDVGVEMKLLHLLVEAKDNKGKAVYKMTTPRNEPLETPGK